MNERLQTLLKQLRLSGLSQSLDVQVRWRPNDARALDLFGKKDDAWILKLMAQSYERAGDRYTARLCLAEALRLDPSLTGIRELKRRLEV